MKMKKFTLGLVALTTLFTLNVQWFELAQRGYLFNVTEAQYYDNEIIGRTPDQDGGGGGFGGGEGGQGYDFLYDEEILEILVPEDVERTPTVPNPNITGITKLNCPWECGEQYWYPAGFYAIPQMCTEGNTLIADIQADINAGRTGDWDGAGGWGANSVYDAGENVAWDGVWVWERHQISTGIGWTAWWVGLANYCESNGWWSSSNKEDITYGETATLTFTIAENIQSGTGDWGLDWWTATIDTLTMKGEFNAAAVIPGGQTVTTPSFNSPFVYLEVPDGEYKVTLDSHFDLYQSVTPAFTGRNLWEVEVNNGKLSVAGKETNHLFYELATPKVDLTRNGVSFDSKEALVSFLEDSDFFANLHMSDTEKQNSLEYLLPRLGTSPYYYLTILDEGAVSALSEIAVTPTPEQLVRTYYAVYPTLTPVKSSGELLYPSAYDSNRSVVKEYGEIIVKPEMYVIWK